MKNKLNLKRKRLQIQNSLQVAREYLETDQIEQAVEHYNKILKGNPDNGPALLGLAAVYLNEGSTDKATELSRKALNKTNSQVSALMLLCKIEQKNNNPEKALQYLNMVIDKEPSLVKPRAKAAKILMELGDYGSAEIQLIQALKYNPQSVEAALVLTNVFLKLEKNDQAFEFLDNMIVRVPDSPMLYLSRARLFIRKGKTGEAIKDLWKVREFDPQNIQAAAMLGSLLVSDSQATSAIKLFHEFLEINPGKKIIQLNLARAYIEEGAYEEARKLLHSLSSGDKQFAGVVHLMLGDIYRRNHRFSHALDEYRAVIINSPEILEKNPELNMINDNVSDLEVQVKSFRKLFESINMKPFKVSAELEL